MDNFLYSPALLVHGSSLAPPQLMAIAHHRYPGKRCCALRHWIIIDVLASKQVIDTIQRHGLQPTIIYGQPCNADPQTAAPANGNVVSEYQVSFDDCFFETKETVYILLENGARHSLDIKLVAMLAES